MKGELHGTHDRPKRQDPRIDTNEWSEVARADIRRRDLLIQLGLAKRKKRNADSPTVGGEDGE